MAQSSSERLGGCPAVEDFELPARYGFRGNLGKGGMGWVIQVHDRERNEDVALKVLTDLSPERILQFKREFRALADLSHPNLVVLYELAVSRSHWYYTMELVRGLDFVTYGRLAGEGWSEVFESLTYRNADQPTVDQLPVQPGSVGRPGEPIRQAQVSRLRRLLAQLLSGLVVLHRAGKLHRDVKPANVLVTRRERVVLLDFGLVQERGHPSDEILGVTAGTPRYAAPELFSEGEATDKSDLYSLGVMLHEVLAGCVPPRPDKSGESRPATALEGVPDAARDLCRLCVDLLAPHPVDRPTAEEALAFLEAATDQAPTLAPAEVRRPASPPVFVGRTAELASVREAFEASRRERAIIMALTGPSGVGKSALVERFLAELSEEGAVVLRGRCYEREAVPFKALDGVVDDLTHWLYHTPLNGYRQLLPSVTAANRLFPVLRRSQLGSADTSTQAEWVEAGDPSELRHCGFDELRALFKQLSMDRSVVLWIDDAHWGDRDSAELLSALLGVPDPPPLLLLASYRPELARDNPFLEGLRRLPRISHGATELRELALSGLTSDETRELASAVLSAGRSNDLADAVARESQGHPFFALQLADYLDSVGLRDAEVTLDDVLEATINGLPEAARRLLGVLAVAGRPLPRPIAMRTAELAPPTTPIVHSLRVAKLARGLDSAGSERLNLEHDRIRPVVLELLGDEAVRQVHYRLATAFEQAENAEPNVLAEHFLAAGTPERAYPYAKQAARKAAEALAFEWAAYFYEVALRNPALEREERRRLQVELADAFHYAGHFREAAEVGLAASEGASRQQATVLRQRAAYNLLKVGELERGRRTLEETMASVGLRPPRPGRVLLSLLIDRLRLRFRSLVPVERPIGEISDEHKLRIDMCLRASTGLFIMPLYGFAVHTRGLLMALDAGDSYRCAEALLCEAGFVLAHKGTRGMRRTDRVLNSARAFVERSDSRLLQTSFDVAEAEVQIQRGLFRRGLQRQKLALTQLGEFDPTPVVPAFILLTGLIRVWALYWLGDLEELSSAIQRYIGRARSRENPLELGGNLLWVCVSAAAVDDLQQARAAHAEARELLHPLTSRPTLTDLAFPHLNAMFKLYEGDGPGALDVVESGLSPAHRLMLRGFQFIRVDLLHRRAACAVAAASGADRPGRLLRRAARLARRLWRETVPYARGLSVLVRAGVAEQRGDRSGAEALYREAERRLRHADIAVHAAVAQRRWGEVVGGVEGDAAIAEADAFMKERGIVKPERWAAVYAPRLSDPAG